MTTSTFIGLHLSNSGHIFLLTSYKCRALQLPCQSRAAHAHFPRNLTYLVHLQEMYALAAPMLRYTLFVAAVKPTSIRATVTIDILTLAFWDTPSRKTNPERGGTCTHGACKASFVPYYVTPIAPSLPQAHTMPTPHRLVPVHTRPQTSTPLNVVVSFSVSLPSPS